MADAIDPRSEELSALCASCGACCNGTIFGLGRLADGEADALKHRLAIRREANEFMLPCPSFQPGSGCGMYDVRPAACRAYRCKLHRDMGEGRVAGADAIARVRRIRDLSEAIRARLPAGPEDLWYRIERSAGATARAIAQTDPQLALDVAELAMRLRRDLGVGEEERGQEMHEKAADP